MTMRKAVFGLGGVQVAGDRLGAGLAGLAFGLRGARAVVVGLPCRCPRPRSPCRSWPRRRELASAHGRASFAILLFQDLAVIPILALLPLLAPARHRSRRARWLAVVKALGVIAVVIVGGRYLLRYVLRLSPGRGVHEVFTAMALFTVIGVALLMEMVGLSMALGAFLAGVLLAEFGIPPRAGGRHRALQGPACWGSSSSPSACRSIWAWWSNEPGLIAGGWCWA